MLGQKSNHIRQNASARVTVIPHNERWDVDVDALLWSRAPSYIISTGDHVLLSPPGVADVPDGVVGLESELWSWDDFWLQRVKKYKT